MSERGQQQAGQPPKRAVVTGAAGFLGSHLVDALLSRGCEVIGVDDLSMGTLDNLRGPLGGPAFHFVHGDVRQIAELCRGCGPIDVVAHLAARKIPRYQGSLETLLVNGEGGHACVRFALQHGARIVLVSTSDIYGKHQDVPFSEEQDSLFGPSQVRRWDYAISKLYEERLCYAYAQAHGLDFVIARLFGSYGPRQHRSWWGGPQAVFIEAALDGQPLEIHGDGLQTRSLTHISDTVAGLMACVETVGASGGVFNIGSTEEVSIIELARAIYRLSGGAGEPPLRFVPYSSFAGRYEDVRRRIPEVRRARQVLGFEARVSLEEGLAQTIAWQRALRLVVA